MNDIIGAIRGWLAIQSSITALTQDRIFVNRLPRSLVESEDTFRPRKSLVVQQAGGPGRADRIALSFQDIEVICYGETDLEADKVRREVWEAFRLLSRVRQNTTLIHHVNPVGGALTGKDPDIVWPFITQTFQTLASTEVN